MTQFNSCQWRKFPVIFLLVLNLVSQLCYAAVDAMSLLKEADQARGGVAKGVQWQVKLDSTEDGEVTSTTYIVRAKASNAHVKVIEPARSKNELMIFNDRTIWFFKPSLRKPVAISARQKLSGQAANGDIASTNYARDYSGTIVGEEKVDGEDCYLLELKSIAESSSYDGIRYWISKKRKLGLKSEFLSLQGKTMKIATIEYGNTIAVDGKKYPFVSMLKIMDAKNGKNFSVMTYSHVKEDRPADSLFNVNNLQR